jgi:hypothetical protein
MDRRNFLSFAAATTVAAATALTLGLEVHDRTVAPASPRSPSDSRRYRGTHDGKIYVSHDGGRSWKLLSDFGPALRVTKVKASPRSVVATLALGGAGTFRIRLMHNDRTWHTT